MKKKLRLMIPLPCNQQWEEMAIIKDGRFCQSCQKEVIDFTAMSDAEMVAFFSNRKAGEVCGRVSEQQLNREIKGVSRRNNPFKYLLNLVVPAMLSFGKISAQKFTRNVESTVVADKSVEAKKTVRKDVVPVIFRGKVTDENGKGIAFASVTVNGTTWGTATNEEGDFLLEFATEHDSVFLAVSCVGFERAETGVSVQHKEHLYIRLKPGPDLEEVLLKSNAGRFKISGLIGAIVIREHFVDFLRDSLFPGPLLKIYPLPARKNSFVTVEFKKGGSGKYSFEWVSLDGQLLSTKQVEFITGQMTTYLEVPNVPAGMYILRVVNRKTGKVQSSKLLVQ